MDEKIKSVGQPVCRFNHLVDQLETAQVVQKVAESASNGLLMAMLKSTSSNSSPLELI